MRHSITVFAGLGIFCLTALVATTAEAQPKSRREKPVPPGHRMRKTVPPGHAKRTAPNLCPQTAAVLQQRQNRLDDRNADLAGVEAEINQLRNQLRALETQRDALRRSVSRESTWVNAKQKEYDQQCKQSESCSQYEQLATTLENQTRPYESDLANIEGQIGSQSRTVQDLQRRVEPLRREYEQRQCNNLVAGQTSQSTIDRCAAIFSDWNRMQAQINDANNKIVTLKRSYEQTLAALKNTERRAQAYETYLTRNCRTSKKLAVMRRYRGVVGRAARLGGELDKLIKNVAQLRSVTITVTPK